MEYVYLKASCNAILLTKRFSKDLNQQGTLLVSGIATPSEDDEHPR